MIGEKRPILKEGREKKKRELTDYQYLSRLCEIKYYYRWVGWIVSWPASRSTLGDGGSQHRDLHELKG